MGNPPRESDSFDVDWMEVASLLLVGWATWIVVGLYDDGSPIEPAHLDMTKELLWTEDEIPFDFIPSVVRRKSSSSSMSMEASPQLSRSEHSPEDHRDPNPSPRSPSISSSLPIWPTVDGPLGLTEDDSVAYARKFYRFGFALLPWLWAVNCFYFWPVLSNPRSFPQIRPYIIRSAVGVSVFTALLCTWALTFSLGGERLFGSTWDRLLMYNLADKWGLTGWD